MEIEALKDFPISPDGTRTFVLTCGARLNVRDELGQGLIKSGLAKEFTIEAAVAEQDDNPFLDDEPEAEPEAPVVKTTRKARENKDAGSRSRRS